MSILFSESKTCENLMRAFAGESQARNRYTIAAEQAKKENLYAVSKVFEFTADQECAHAKVFYDLLEELSGKSIKIDGSYPVDIYPDMKAQLGAAQHNELEEYSDVYPSFGKTAEEENFITAASAFYQIAEIEKIHADRFGALKELLENNHMYARIDGGKWMCLNCGHIYEGTDVPPICPVCKHDKGFFIPFKMSPYNSDGAK